MKLFNLLIPISTLLLTPIISHAEENTVNQLLRHYTDQGALIANKKQGELLWTKKFDSQRSCSACHTNNLTAFGKHQKTGKKIKPMSPSVNAKRLSNSKKVEKWFKRNCKWTMGRECTAQEKANLIVYINQPVSVKF